MGIASFVKIISVALAAFFLLGCGDLNTLDDDSLDQVNEPDTDSFSMIGQISEISQADTTHFRAYVDRLDDASVWAVWLEDHAGREQLMVRRYLTKNYLWDVSSTRLDTSDRGASLAQLAIDPIGSVMAIWTQENEAGRSELTARYYNKYHGRWRPAEVIDSPLGGDSDSPIVVATDGGQVMAIWRQLEGDTWRVMGATYNPRSRYYPDPDSYVAVEGVWSSPVMLGQGMGSVDDLQLVVDSNETSTALWREFDGTVNNLWVARRSVSGAWTTAISLNDSGEGSVLSAKIAVDFSGNVTVAWVQNKLGIDSLWVTRYNRNQALWQTATALESSDFDVAEYELAKAPYAEPTVVWLQNNGVAEQLWVSQFQSNAWQAGKAMGLGVNPTDDFLLLASHDGSEVRLTWRETANDGQSLWSQYYRDAEWYSAERVDNGSTGAALSQLTSVLDRDNNVTLAWLSDAGQYQSVLVNRYNDGSGWQGASALDVLNEGDARDPKLLLNGRVDVTILWSQYHEGDHHLLTAHYYKNLGRWGGVDKIDRRINGDELNFDFIIDGVGNVTSFWLQEGDEGKLLWSNRF